MKQKPHITDQIQKLDARISELRTDFAFHDQALRNLYSITDEHFEYDYGTWSENDYEYTELVSELKYETDYKISKLNAHKAAVMLIGYNIARRGKPLHESVVLKKTRKLGADGEFIRNQMTPVRTPRRLLAALPYLHTALEQYGIILLDSNRYKLLIQDMERVVASDIPQDKKERLINKYATQLKLFNVQIRKDYEEKQKTK